jgi:tetratricopeptide (TPR) repeat protein
MNQYQQGSAKGREKELLFDQVLEALKAYSDRNPSDPSGYLERFRLYAEKQQYPKAEEELLRVLERFPKYPSIHLLKGNLYLAMNDHRTAFLEYQIELKNNPNNADALLAIGKEYIGQGNYDEALKSLSQAMRVAPGAAEPKHWAGWATFLEKNYLGAVALYQAAIQIDSGNPMIYKRLGSAYKMLGNEQAAGAAFKRYLELAPDAPDRADFERYL